MKNTIRRLVSAVNTLIITTGGNRRGTGRPSNTTRVHPLDRIHRENDAIAIAIVRADEEKIMSYTRERFGYRLGLLRCAAPPPSSRWRVYGLIQGFVKVHFGRSSTVCGHFSSDFFDYLGKFFILLHRFPIFIFNFVFSLGNTIEHRA